MHFEWVLLAGLAALLLGGVAWLQHHRHTPMAYWIGGWIAAGLSALLGLPALGFSGSEQLAFPFSTFSAWLMLAGARTLAGAPAWPGLFRIALVLGVARSVGAEAFGLAPAYWAGLATDVPAWLAAAVFVGRAVPKERASLAQRTVAPALVGLAVLTVGFIAWVATGGGLRWAVGVGIVTMPFFLGIQLRAGADWVRQELERAIAERTAELAAVNVSLRASEERYRTVSELGSDLSFGFRVRSDGTVEGEWVTDAFESITGYSGDELSPEEVVEVIHPEDREGVATAFHAARRTGVGTLAFRIVRKDGGVRWLEARERVVRDGDGFRVLGAARDVSVAREAAAQRQQLERQMLEAQRIESLGLVTGGVAHDFSNVLTVVLGNLRLALAELPDASPLRTRLERALVAAEHGEELTEQMLVYAGGAPQARKPLQLSALVDDMRRLARAALDGDVRLFDSLAPDVWVEGDETQLRQVVLNLVANAGEALAGRGGRIDVTTRLVDLRAEDLAGLQGGAALAAGRYAVLEVTDDGPGMDPETQRRVFEPFFSTKLAGRGLGLASVLGIVRGHGGGIEVRSAPGEGTCFRVVLPRAAGATQPAPEVPAPHPKASGLGRVLVIDDQEPVLELAQELLGRAGYGVETALGGRDGLARCEADPGRFDAVVLDLAMPDLDGTRVGLALRALRADLPLLLVSGFGADLDADILAALEPVDLLPKPYRSEALAEALAALLARTEAVQKAP
ncbi:MAG: ATP-binding protein [Myxococcota bacterium]